jgi:hypothetical protein
MANPIEAIRFWNEIQHGKLIRLHTKTNEVKHERNQMSHLWSDVYYRHKTYLQRLGYRKPKRNTKNTSHAVSCNKSILTAAKKKKPQPIHGWGF